MLLRICASFTEHEFFVVVRSMAIIGAIALTHVLETVPKRDQWSRGRELIRSQLSAD
jgi:hypothetical protein